MHEMKNLSFFHFPSKQNVNLTTLCYFELKGKKLTEINYSRRHYSIISINICYLVRYIFAERIQKVSVKMVF